MKTAAHFLLRTLLGPLLLTGAGLVQGAYPSKTDMKVG